MPPAGLEAVDLSHLSRFPRVEAAVRGATALQALAVSAYGDATLCIDGRHLTSAFDRRAEAALQAERIPDDATVATVYGVALGDLPRALLARPALERLRVVVLSPALLRTSLPVLDSAWMGDPRVDLVLAADESGLRRPYTVAPACLVHAEEAALRIRDEVMLDLAAAFQAEKHAEREPMLLASIESNQARLASDADVASLFGRHRGATAVVVGAGPTLSETVAWLASVRKEVTVIAVTSALLPLQAASVVPDYAIAVDPTPAVGEHLTGLDPTVHASIPLVYALVVHPSVLQRWPGTFYSAYLMQPRYDAVAAATPRGRLQCSGTVTHTAVDLAVRMGAHRVVLLGADFAYVGGKSHAKGASQERGAPVAPEAYLTNGHGENVPSDLAMIGFLRDLERYIAASPAVDFRLVSRDGAAIAGTSWI